MATRWGICGAGGISRLFTPCPKWVPSTEHQVVAVAARDLERAQKFAEDFDIAKAYGSYEEMAKDPDVDVVYIGTLHTVHYDNTILFLNHGKHVLVEKPSAMNLKQLKEMTSLAREKKLFFMEGIWTRFFPVYHKVVEELKNGTIGQVKLLKSELCLPCLDWERLKQNSLGGGALMSLGCYPLHIALFLLGKPDKITIEGTMAETDVDEAVSLIFKYNDGCMAQMFFSMAFQGENETVIYGTKGQIKVHSPMWCPSDVTLPSGKVTYKLPDIDIEPSVSNDSGFVYQVNHVRQCIIEGKTESPVVPMSNSEYVMGVMDQIRAEIGLHFEADSQ